MNTRVLLVRHGERILSGQDRFAGSTDVPLSADGRQQAECLAARLAEMPIAAVYASPMQRTHDTAAIVARPHDLPIVGDVDLREIDHGRWEQLRRDDVQERFPEEYRAWAEDPFTCAPQGGESGAQLLARALPAIRRIVAAHEGQAVLVVSHKATIRLVIASLLGIDLRGYRDRLDQSLASLNILDFTSPTQTRLTVFNDVSHYAETFW